jgi:hypothetical protein
VTSSRAETVAEEAVDDPGADRGGEASDDGRGALAGYASALAQGIEDALPGWVIAGVARVYRASVGAELPEEWCEQAAAAGARAQSEVGSRLRALLAADIDEQRTTPLALLRRAVDYPTEVLVAAGVEPVARDDYATSAFPDDCYGLTPASLADIDPGLAEMGLAWGAAKAWVHLHRHRGS